MAVIPNIDVEVRDGEVLAVWYGNTPLPFIVTEASQYRAKELKAGYKSAYGETDFGSENMKIFERNTSPLPESPRELIIQNFKSDHVDDLESRSEYEL